MRENVQPKTNEDLAARIQAGEPELMADLWDNCQKLLFSLMYQELAKGKRALMVRRGLTDEDIMQELFFALKGAVKDFKPEANLKFTSYLHFHVKNAINKALGIRSGGKCSNDPLDWSASLDEPVADGDTPFGDFLQDPESDKGFNEIEEADYLTRLHVDMEMALKELSERHEQTIRSRYYDDKTLKEIAEDQSISHEQVRQNEHAALLKLREAQALQSYRENIIEKYSYRSGLRVFKINNFTSGVEIAAMRLVMEEERMKKRAARVAKREIEQLRATRSERHFEELAPLPAENPSDQQARERKRKNWR